MNDRFVKFFCPECGKWLGSMRETANTAGIYPFCPRCKKPVSVTAVQRFKSAKCQQH